MTGEEIRQQLRTEHGVDVPLPTVRRWVREGAEPLEPPTSTELSERVQSIIASELRRIERQARPDLERLARCAQILKTVESARQAPKRKARSLADLNGPSEATEAGTVRLAA
jgi:hypothetical protein